MSRNGTTSLIEARGLRRYYRRVDTSARVGRGSRLRKAFRRSRPRWLCR